MAFTQDALLLLICLASSIIVVRTIFTKTQTRSGLPPSPRRIPIIGHMHHLGPVLPKAYHNLSTRYGSLIYFFIGSKPCVLVSSPEMAKEFLKTNESNFMNRPKTANLDFITYGSSDFATVHYGPYWKFMKKLCMTELLGGRTLEHLLPIREEETKRFLKLILKKAEAREAANFGEELMRLTNNIITRMTLGQRCSESEDEAGEVRKLVKELNVLGAKFNLSDTIWFCKNFDFQGFKKQIKDARDRYDVMMERIMKENEDERTKVKKERREGSKIAKDLLDILLDIYEDENAEMRLTRENIKAFIMNIFGAGTDTSSITIEWGLAELINQPELMEKARREIDSVIGKGRIVKESDIANLPYLQAVVKEILRLHPTGPLVVRESSEECTIAEYRIPAKTRLFVNLYSLGRDPNHWENPLEFIPERFLSEDQWSSKSQFLDVRGQYFHMIPFGSGRRSCPGATLALQFVPTTLAAIIQCFELKAGDGGNGRVDMEEGPGLTLPRAHSLLCTPVARLTPFPSI